MYIELIMYFINLLVLPVIAVALFYRENKKDLKIDAEFLVTYASFVVGIITFFRLLNFLLRPTGITLNYSRAYYTILSLIFSFFIPSILNIIKKNSKNRIYFVDKTSPKPKIITYYTVSGIIFLIAVLLYVICDWTVESFGVGLDEIIFTVSSPLKGADSNITTNIVKRCLPYIITIILIFLSLIIIGCRTGKTAFFNIELKKSHRINLTKAFRILIVILTIVSLILSCFFINSTYNIIEYLFDKTKQSTIYEEHYIDPENIEFKSPTQKKNLIYIYLESMEITYASKEIGGFQDVNYIPNLTNLLDDGITFSNKPGVGGFYCPTGTTYTMGSLLATTSGVHFGFPVGYNSMSDYENFAPGLVTLGDILSRMGYTQEFLCGSDANFAGRRNYFEQHGNYEIFDLYTAREKSYIPKDYSVFWGYEDLYLYKIARDELTRLAAQDKPFNLTMLTVDTHHISGYVCEKCSNDYEVQTANVVACADSQLQEFVEWIKQQDFYKDSVIIITGDHPRMDNDLVGDIPYYDRTIYNCIINSDTQVKGETTNRSFANIDMFPTILSALGISWDSNKLGLGTDMFSGEKTLTEKLSMEYINSEFDKKSIYFTKNFQ